MLTQVWLVVFAALASVFAQPAQPDYFVEAVVDNPAPYVGQQIMYTFRVYTAVSLPRTDFVPPDFEGFWRTEVGPATSYVQFVEGKLYTVTELDTALYPSYAGELIIEPAVLTLPATVFREAEVLRSAPVPVVAQALPDNAPPGFAGAVGQFEMTATLDRQIASIGEPFTLRLQVTGSGNVEQLSPPAVAVPDDWRLYENGVQYIATQTETGLVGEKVFEWLLLPTTGGDFVLPPVSLAYFDPDTGGYRTIDTVAMGLQVLGEAGVNDTSVGVADPLTVPAARPVSGGLRPASTGMNPVALVFWLMPPLAVAGVWWWQRRAQTVASRRHLQRQAGALDRARMTLQSANRATNQAGARLVIQAIGGYLDDKLLREPGQTDMAGLDTAMAAHGVSEKLRQHVQQCVDSAYSSRFAPMESSDVSELVAHTARALAAVDREWQP